MKIDKECLFSNNYDFCAFFVEKLYVYKQGNLLKIGIFYTLQVTPYPEIILSTLHSSQIR